MSGTATAMMDVTARARVPGQETLAVEATGSAIIVVMIFPIKDVVSRVRKLY